jgi:hypothetical protein
VLNELKEIYGYPAGFAGCIILGRF